MHFPKRDARDSLRWSWTFRLYGRPLFSHAVCQEGSNQRCNEVFRSAKSFRAV